VLPGQNIPLQDYEETPRNKKVICLEMYNFFFEFCDLTMLVGQHEEHPAYKKPSGGMLARLSAWARCRFAYGPADATASHCLLLQ